MNKDMKASLLQEELTQFGSCNKLELFGNPSLINLITTDTCSAMRPTLAQINSKPDFDYVSCMIRMAYNCS